MHFLYKLIVPLCAVQLLVSCSSETPEEPVLRGIKTVVIDETNNTFSRNYPTKLESRDMSTLSFQLGGQLGEKRLEVGQHVQAGQVLFALNPKSLQLAVGEAEAGLQQALANASDTANELSRQRSLFQQKIVSKAKIERAQTATTVANAQVKQARQQLGVAKDNLSKAKLKAPFDGVISDIKVDSYEIVNAGQAIVSLHKPNNFEAKFNVSYDVINQLSVGQPAVLKVGNRHLRKQIKGIISELGSSADSVSSFPVVVKVVENDPSLKSGASVEVQLTVVVDNSVTHILPLSALITEGDKVYDGSEAAYTSAVYVYDEASQTVKRRTVQMIGVRDNQLLVSEGLNVGDRVAVAGIPFLREGLKVKLLPDNKNK